MKSIGFSVFVCKNTKNIIVKHLIDLADANFWTLEFVISSTLSALCPLFHASMGWMTWNDPVGWGSTIVFSMFQF